MDPLAGTAWSKRSTVDGFARGTPNPVLIDYAAKLMTATSGRRAVDIGCGAGRNASPLAALGWDVIGLDLSWPMLQAAQGRAREGSTSGSLAVALAPMHALPIRACSCN